MLLYVIIALLTILALAEAWLIGFLAIDRNYGILNATAGLTLIRFVRRRRDLILLDLDNFKAFNAAHGHTEADCRVRRAMQALHFRRGDGIRVVKRGGDELLISCPVGRADETIDRVQARLLDVGLTATACIAYAATDMYRMLAEAERAILAAKTAGNKNTILYLSNS
jgi:predicted signal transduction protein with EAL and GGDEF domain